MLFVGELLFVFSRTPELIRPAADSLLPLPSEKADTSSIVEVELVFLFRAAAVMSSFRWRRRRLLRRKIRAAIKAIATMPTATKVPATLPASLKKPVFFLACNAAVDDPVWSEAEPVVVLEAELVLFSEAELVLLSEAVVDADEADVPALGNLEVGVAVCVITTVTGAAVVPGLVVVVLELVVKVGEAVEVDEVEVLEDEEDVLETSLELADRVPDACAS